MKVPYYFDNRIHNLGNVGILGRIHAELAPMSTNLINNVAYSGKSVRKEILKKYCNGKNVLDLCCGVGLSTLVDGIDTSDQMIEVAKNINKTVKGKKNFYIGNAENYKPIKEYDIVTCMFAFHEMPQEAHKKILWNSLEIAKKEIIILDISPEKEINKFMLSGEPYIKEYQKTIENTLIHFEREDIIKNRVTCWRFIK